jgi:hypothetical protein
MDWQEIDRVRVPKDYGEFLGLATLRRYNHPLIIARFARCNAVVGQPYLDTWKDIAVIEYAIAHAKPENFSE